MEKIPVPYSDPKRHFLKGPYNPLEMKVFGKIKSLQGKAIQVEDDSVNSILLDDQPGDPHERVSLGNFHIFKVAI